MTTNNIGIFEIERFITNLTAMMTLVVIKLESLDLQNGKEREEDGEMMMRLIVVIVIDVSTRV